MTHTRLGSVLSLFNRELLHQHSNSFTAGYSNIRSLRRLNANSWTIMNVPFLLSDAIFNFV